MLKGELVVLRPAQRSDGKYYLKWCNDPEIIQFDTEYLPLTEMAQEKWWDNVPEGKYAHFMMDAVDGQVLTPIGDVGLHNINAKDQNASFGIMIGEKEYWSRGYGTDATKLIIRYGFEQLNLYRIYSWVWSFNIRSIRLHHKLGFTEEGRRREIVYKNGAYYDEVMFGLLREEWKK